MNCATSVDAVQYAERIRRMIWTDMVDGRLPTAIADYRSLRSRTDADDYLLRADLPSGDLLALGACVAAVEALLDEWIKAGDVRMPYGAFTPRDVILLTDFLRAAERSQPDVEILARMAGEWLAGIHATTSAGEFEHDHSHALLALTHDVLAR